MSKPNEHFQSGDVESYSAAPADSLRRTAQPAGMLKPLAANKLDARILPKESRFSASEAPSNQHYSALSRDQAQLGWHESPRRPYLSLPREGSGLVAAFTSTCKRLAGFTPGG